MTYQYTISCANDATSEVLGKSPVGWDDKAYVFQENETYHGIISQMTIDKLGFTRDEKTVKGGLNYILSKYDMYGVEAELSILVKYRNPATNAFDTLINGVLSWSDSPEQASNQDDDAFYMSISDSSDRERFRENDEIDVNIRTNKDLQGKSITTESAVSVTITGQDLFKEVYANADTDSGLQLLTTDLDLDINLDSDLGGENSTNNIGDVIVIDGSQKKIYTNEIGSDTEVTFIAENGNREISLNIINSSPGSNALFTVDYSFVIERYNSSDVQQSTDTIDSHGPQLISFTTATYEDIIQADFDYNETLTLDEGDYIQVWCNFKITLGINIDSSSSCSLVNQFDLSLLEKSYTPGDTDSYLMLAHEATENLLQIITGNTSPLYSPILGRTDIGYDSDGFLGLVGVGMGWQLRQFPLAFKSITLNFKDWFQSLNAITPIYLGYDEDNQRFVLDSIENRYGNTVLIEINNPAKFKRTFKESLYFNLIKAGQRNKVEYDIYNGVEEAMTPYDYGSSLAFKNTYDISSPYNLDPTGIEVLRRNRYYLTASTDTKNDDNVYLVRLERDGGSYKTKKLGVGEETANILNGSTRLNLEFTAKRNLIRHGRNIRTIYHKNSSGVFRYLNSQLKSDMGTKLSGEGAFTYENTDLSVTGLGTHYVIPEVIEFEYPITDSLLTLIKSTPYEVFQVVVDKVGTFYGYIGLDGVRTNKYDRSGNWVLRVKSYFDTTDISFY